MDGSEMILSKCPGQFLGYCEYKLKDEAPPFTTVERMILANRVLMMTDQLRF